MNRSHVLLLVLAACGSTPTPAESPEPTTGGEASSEPEAESAPEADVIVVGTNGSPPERHDDVVPVFPHARETAPLLVAPPPSLAALEAAYGDVLAFELSHISAPTLTAQVEELARRLQESLELVMRVDAVAAPLTTDPELGYAWARRGDARDALAARIVATSLPLPADLEAQLVDLSQEAAQEVRRQIAARLRELLVARARHLWCEAVAAYQHATAHGSIEAAAQLARYGPDLIASCEP